MSEKRLNLLTMQEAMDLLEISRSTLDRWRKDKKLPFIKIGKEVYFHKDDLQFWLRRHTQVLDSMDLSNHHDDNNCITIGYQSGTAHMWTPILIKEFDLLAEELANIDRSRHWNIKWKNAANGLELVEGMITGEIQIASLGDYPILVAERLGQILPKFHPALLAFDGKSINGRGIAIVVPNRASVHEPSDLYQTIFSTVQNSSAGQRLKKMLASIGNIESQVIHQEMEESLAGIINGRVQASAMWEPYISLINYHGKGRVLFPEGMGGDYLTGVVADSNWSSTNESLVIAYLKAHLRAHSIARIYPEKAARMIARSTGLPIVVVAQVLSRVRWDAAVYKRDLQTLKNLDSFDAVNLGQMVRNENNILFDSRFLEQAANKLRLPLLSSNHLNGDWSNELLY